MKKPISFIGLLACYVLFNTTFAQSLPCESLLENYPQPTVEITTVVQKITSDVSIDHQTAQTVVTQTLDYLNRRLVQESEAMGAKTIVRYVDGEASMSVAVGENTMSVPIPEESGKSLEAIFDQPLLQGVPQNVTVVSCDGPQSYADLVAGEQVTVKTTVPNMGEMTSKIIFSKNGKTQGAISSPSGAGGEMLMVFEELTLDEANVPTHMKMTMYRLEGDTATLFTTTMMDILSYNESVDEAFAK
ncbi:MAG: hypothetical protein ACRCYY_15355 [Trueperaceae bacterium]